jgi:hypothetical protein
MQTRPAVHARGGRVGDRPKRSGAVGRVVDPAMIGRWVHDERVPTDAEPAGRAGERLPVSVRARESGGAEGASDGSAHQGEGRRRRWAAGQRERPLVNQHEQRAVIDRATQASGEGELRIAADGFDERLNSVEGGFVREPPSPGIAGAEMARNKRETVLKRDAVEGRRPLPGWTSCEPIDV